MQLNLEITNSYIKITSDSTLKFKELNQTLKKEISFFQDGYMFNPLFKRGLWDGKKSFYKYDIKSGYAPTGIANLLVRILDNYSIPYSIIDTRIIPNKEYDFKLSLKYTPNFYQLEAVEASLNSSRGIIQLPTGSGKMFFAVLLTAKLGLTTVVLCKGKESIQQTYEEFKSQLSDDPRIGYFDSTHKDIKPITIASVDSLSNPMLLEHFKNNCNLQILDEAHQSAAENLFDNLVSGGAYYKIGMTGTPFREDYKGVLLEAASGRVIYQKTVKELQDLGFLSKSEVIFIQAPAPNHIDPYDLRHYDKDSLYEHGIVSNEPRNYLIDRILDFFVGKLDRTVLCTVKLLKHGENLSTLTGYEFSSGQLKKKERQDVLSRLISGETKVIIANKIYDQSTNIPRLSVNVQATGFSNQLRQEQRFGRILRKKEDENQVSFFVDFIDSFTPKLMRHSKERMKFWQDLGVEIHVCKDFSEFTKLVLKLDKGSKK